MRITLGLGVELARDLGILVELREWEVGSGRDEQGRRERVWRIGLLVKTERREAGTAYRAAREGSPKRRNSQEDRKGRCRAGVPARC
jgi:hypothetical protein